MAGIEVMDELPRYDDGGDDDGGGDDDDADAGAEMKTVLRWPMMVAGSGEGGGEGGGGDGGAEGGGGEAVEWCVLKAVALEVRRAQ